MHVIVQFFHKFLKIWHPTDCEMAILKQNPTSFLWIIDGQVVSFLTLSLTEWNGLNPFAHAWLFGKSQEISCWIRTCWEYENEWSLYGWVFVTFGKIKGWWDDKSFTHFLSDPVLDTGDDFVRSEGFNDKHFLEVSKFFFPIFREWFLMSIGWVEDMFELIWFFHEVFVNAFEVFQSGGHAFKLFVDIGPGCFRDPGGGIGGHLDFSSGTDKQEPELILIKFLISKENLGCQHKGEDEFVLFEQRSADVFVQTVREVIVHAVEPLLQHVGRRRVL